MQGFWFYWVMWLIIIGLYFFNDDKVKKEKWIGICLIVLISSIINVSFIFVSVGVSAMIFAFLAFKYIAEQKKGDKYFLYFISTLISGLYLFIYYFVYFEPVWLYVSPLTIINTLTLAITVVFLKKHQNRLAVTIGGLIQGDILLCIMLSERTHPSFGDYIIGNHNFLDLLALTILMIIFWNGLEQIVNSIKRKWFSGNQTTPSTHGKLNA